MSHDIIEGEILSAAYVSDCQALDAFPSNELSYLKRLHRWVRGDWQNSVFLFERSFSCLSKFKIFDNLRRSVTPVFALLCITASSLSPRKESLLLFITALLSLTINEVISFLRRGEAAPLIRAFVSLTMLPAEALVCLDGAVKGLYRRLVSGKNMLLWTTASESERSRACRTLFLLPNIIFGLLIFSPRFYIKALALIFILNIPFFILSGKKEKIKKPKIDEKTKKMLLSDAEKMWLYYKNFANAENNFLPPDNVGAHITKRTSPTDIGMMLLACLASFDLNIINRDEMLSFLNDAITSAERLSTVHGNLYNWYDTRTLQPLPPFFVSSVDSGNFVCSLTSLRNGLLHVGGAEELVKRIDKIIGATDLKLFFSEKNDLMSIGVDACGGKKNENSYGVFMSEARLTLYYAVSSRLIPQKFFYGADRRLNSFGGRFGPASWNGTLFEYFMPNIFLPAYENTFEREGLSFCLYCQKKYARKNKIPFGISESCYFDFDENMNYLYKAHGVKRLALNRGIENSFVVSPYSSYLILPFDSDFALGNLNRLRNIGAYGEYGFFEAYDFSENEAVKCFMAHHIGMSILSIDNYLNDYIMQKRFLDGKMLSGELLLHERKRKL